MRARRWWMVLVVAVVLLTAVAIPAAAEDDPSTLWVSRVKIAYNGRSSSSSDRMVGQVHVRDTDLAFVPGATVTAQWTTPAGATVVQSAVTEFQGVAWFELWAGRGTYTLCVLDVEMDGVAHTPELNAETCTTFYLPVGQ